MVVLITLVLAYSMTKSVVIALILFLVLLRDFIVLGLVLSWWRIEHEMNEDQCISWLAHEKFVRRVPAKRTREKHMIGSWKVMPGCQFCECLVGKAFPWDTCKTLCLKDFLSVTFLPFTHTIYTLITHKSIRRLFREKNSRYVFYNTHTHLLERKLLILSEKSF